MKSNRLEQLAASLAAGKIVDVHDQLKVGAELLKQGMAERAKETEGQRQQDLIMTCDWDAYVAVYGSLAGFMWWANGCS